MGTQGTSRIPRAFSRRRLPIFRLRLGILLSTTNPSPTTVTTTVMVLHNLSNSFLTDTEVQLVVGSILLLASLCMLDVLGTRGLKLALGFLMFLSSLKTLFPNLFPNLSNSFLTDTEVQFARLVSLAYRDCWKDYVQNRCVIY